GGGGPCAEADDAPVVPDQRGGFDAHPQVEVRFIGTCLREQVEEVPLGCDRHERMRQVEAGEGGEQDLVPAASAQRHALDAAVSEAGGLVVVDGFGETPRGAMRANSWERPSSASSGRVEGWMGPPRKSRKKSSCFSRTTTRTPPRASSRPATIPAGPPR